MNLTASGAYAALVNKDATQTCGGKLVTPGDPATSYLAHKIADTVPCFGTRMPQSASVFFPAPNLTNAEIAAITAWISGGAKP